MSVANFHPCRLLVRTVGLRVQFMLSTASKRRRFLSATAAAGTRENQCLLQIKEVCASCRTVYTTVLSCTLKAGQKQLQIQSIKPQVSNAHGHTIRQAAQSPLSPCHVGAFEVLCPLQLGGFGCVLAVRG